MKITIASGRNGSKKEAIQLSPSATLEELKKTYRPSMSIYRKAFKIIDTSAAGAPKSPISGGDGKPSYITLHGDKSTLSSLGVKEGHEVLFKDLGPQVGYRTVFLVEYAGPLGFIGYYASRPALLYGEGASAQPFLQPQLLFIILFAAHFVKRELETLFIHKFSRPTMPLSHIFKNSIYYWAFAAFIGYSLCHPKYTPPADINQSIAGAAFMVFNELMNFAVHFQLSRLRKSDGDNSRKYPGGPLFALVTCPNYFHEVLSWVGFSLGTNILASWVFTAVGLAQMTQWSLKKRSGYVKQVPKLKKKKSIIPFII